MDIEVLTVFRYCHFFLWLFSFIFLSTISLMFMLWILTFIFCKVADWFFGSNLSLWFWEFNADCKWGLPE